MRVVDYQTEISETKTELRTLEKRQSNAKLLLRSQLLGLLKSGEFLQLKKAVGILGRRLKNRVFTTYEEVEKAVIEIAKPIYDSKRSDQKTDLLRLAT